MANRTDKPELHVDTLADWEAWLSSDPDPIGVRLRLRKKATTLPGITYAEALDVALCFGWIDGQSQSVDADYYLQTFTPRRPRSMWSKVNIGHVTRLIEEGRMRPEGQREIDRAKADGRWDAAYRQRDGDLPVELQEALTRRSPEPSRPSRRRIGSRWLSASPTSNGRPRELRALLSTSKCSNEAKPCIDRTEMDDDRSILRRGSASGRSAVRSVASRARRR